MKIDYRKIVDNGGFNLKLSADELEDLMEMFENSELKPTLKQVYLDLQFYLFLNCEADK